MNRKVAVITGASSGIGRLTSLYLAEAGYHLALGARNEQELQKVADECVKQGAEVAALKMDVSSSEEVEELARAAVSQFGKIDVWINNAGVTSVGTFMGTAPDIFRQVIDINFHGVVAGSRAALKRFYQQRYGTLINLSSVFGVVPSPYESAYVASKYAIRGFSASLRQELAIEGLDAVHVCTVLPAAIDTPIYRNAANMLGKNLKPPPPIYDPDAVARAILRCIESPMPEVVIGGSGRVIRSLAAILPKIVFERMFATYINQTHFRNGKARISSGNLFGPSRYASVRGDWPKLDRRMVTAACTGIVLVLALAWAARRARSGADSRG